MSITPQIEDVSARYDAVKAALAGALTSRAHADNLEHFDERNAADLRKGVITLVSDGEGDYSHRPGMETLNGVQRLVIVGQFKVNETDAKTVIQAAEFALMQEIKTFVRAGVPGTGLQLMDMVQSRQQDHPYGWVVATLNAGPTAHNIR